MTILKVKLNRTAYGDHTHYDYPPEYDAQKIQVLCYESTEEESDVITRGNTDEFLIGVVADEDAANFLKSPDITEIPEAAANVLGRRWRPQVENISDEGKVIMILARHARGQQLTQDELDALDPDKSDLGISKSKLFDNLLTEVHNIVNTKKP